MHQRVRTAAEFGRAFGDEIERLGAGRERAGLDAVGDDREHSIEQRRVGRSVANRRICARNLAQACA